MINSGSRGNCSISSGAYVLNWRSIGSRPHALFHPAFHERFRRVPEIEIGIELAAETFDVQQRLLQQHELRLHFHVELARRLKQRDEKVTERNFLERLFEDRFADATNHVLEFGDLRFFRYPAALEVQPRDFAVILIEEREQIASEIILVLVR